MARFKMPRQEEVKLLLGSRRTIQYQMRAIWSLNGTPLAAFSTGNRQARPVITHA